MWYVPVLKCGALVTPVLSMIGGWTLDWMRSLPRGTLRKGDVLIIVGYDEAPFGMMMYQVLVSKTGELVLVFQEDVREVVL